jgi:hypothetical protein
MRPIKEIIWDFLGRQSGFWDESDEEALPAGGDAWLEQMRDLGLEPVEEENDA